MQPALEHFEHCYWHEGKLCSCGVVKLPKVFPLDAYDNMFKCLDHGAFYSDAGFAVCPVCEWEESVRANAV